MREIIYTILLVFIFGFIKKSVEALPRTGTLADGILK